MDNKASNPDIGLSKWKKALFDHVQAHTTPEDRLGWVFLNHDLWCNVMLRHSDELKTRLLREQPNSFQIIRLDQK
ncbi:MAG: hypothetical protein H7144_17885 [Burkholderiales bacterium]|nr:hypothetical protein [Phycisphaerae bacterium]